MEKEKYKFGGKGIKGRRKLLPEIEGMEEDMYGGNVRERKVWELEEVK